VLPYQPQNCTIVHNCRARHTIHEIYMRVPFRNPHFTDHSAVTFHIFVHSVFRILRLVLAVDRQSTHKCCEIIRSRSATLNWTQDGGDYSRRSLTRDGRYCTCGPAMAAVATIHSAGQRCCWKFSVAKATSRDLPVERINRSLPLHEYTVP